MTYSYIIIGIKIPNTFESTVYKKYVNDIIVFIILILFKQIPLFVVKTCTC